MMKMSDILGPSMPEVRAVAVGAGMLGEKSEPQSILIEKGLGTIIGFEPHEAECERLNKVYGARHRYLPHFIGDGSRRTFFQTSHPMTSSLYRPNEAVLRPFQDLWNLAHPEGEETVQTTRLDDIPDIGDIDFFQLDVQGAELDVIRGAAATLKNVVMVHTEVEFVPLYIGQPLVSDVDTALRGAGFLLHRFTTPGGSPFRPLARNDGQPGPMSQILYTDAVYTRDFTRLDQLTPRKLLVLAVLLHELYGSVDMVAFVLRAHKKMTGSDFWERYLTSLTGVRPPADFED